MIDRKVYILLGPPGSGKGTQAKQIAPFLGLPHISLGDLLREAVAKKTEVGRQVEDYLNAGKLVPDEVVIRITEDRIKDKDCDRGFVVDGFPRTIKQAEAFEKILKRTDFRQEKVIYIDLPLKEILKRLTGRRSCRSCGAVYHVDFSPSKKEGICDKCGGELYQRHDDTKDVIETRFRIYEEQTKPLIAHYTKLGILARIDGSRKINEVFGDVRKAIGAKG